MNALLFNRSLGFAGPQALQQAQTARLLNALQSTPNVKFDGDDERFSAKSPHPSNEKDAQNPVWAHRAGVNSISIDKFEGR